MFDRLLKNKQHQFCFFTDGKVTEEKKRKYFPAGYLGKFYRNLMDNVDSFLRSDFDGRIANVLIDIHKTFKSIYLQSAIF